MDAQIINIISLIFSAIGSLCAAGSIWVALYVSKKSSKDILKLIDSNRTDSNSQIKVMIKTSEEEIKQTRILTHTLMIALIHSLASANIDEDSKKDEILNVASTLLARYEQINEQIIKCLKDGDNINVEQLNSLYAEKDDIINKIKNAINALYKINDKLNAVSKAFESLHKPMDAYSNWNCEGTNSL